MVPSFKNTALIFPEISFIQFFTTFQLQYYDTITDLICIIEKRQYLQKETSETISDSAECYAGLSVRFESSAACM